MKSHRLLLNDIEKLYVRGELTSPYLFSLEILSTIKFQTAVLDNELNNVKDDEEDNTQVSILYILYCTVLYSILYIININIYF